MGGKGSREEQITSIPENDINSYLLKKERCIHMTFKEYNDKKYIPTDIFHIEKVINIKDKPPLRKHGTRDRYGLLGSIFPNRNPFEGMNYKAPGHNIDYGSKDSLGKAIDKEFMRIIKDNNIKFFDKKIKKKVEKELKNYANGLRNNVDKKTNKDIYNFLKKYVKKNFKNMVKDVKIDYLNEQDKEYLNKYIENEIKILAEEHGRLPKPIYVMYSRMLELDGNLIEKHLDSKYSDLITRLNSDQDALKNSMFARYGWRGNMKVIIYVPNLRRDGRVPTNIISFKNQNAWMRSLVIDKDLMYSIYRLTNYNFSYLERVVPRSIIDKLIERLESRNNRYYFRNDMTNLCHLHGCVSDTGENLASLLPKYTASEGDMKKAARGKAPYLPQKCLVPYDFHVNGYNPKTKDDKSHSAIMNRLFKKVTEKSLEKCYKEWKKNDEKIQKGEEGDFDIDVNAITEMNTCAIDYIQEKENDKKHYSKWQPKILKELAHRETLHPGIAEIVLPIFSINGLNNEQYSMPWGNDLIPLNYGMGEGQIQKEVASNNGQWVLRAEESGRLGLFNNGRVVSWLNSRSVGHRAAIQLLDGRLEIVALNRYNKEMVFWSVKCSDDVYKKPLSLIVEDNGRIGIYENGMISAIGKEFSNFVDNSLQNWKQSGKPYMKDLKGNNIDETDEERRKREMLEKRGKALNNLDEEQLYDHNKEQLELMNRLRNLFRMYDK